MALRRTLAKRLFTKNTESSSIAIPSPKTSIPPNAAKTNFHRELLTLPDSADAGFFRRFLQRRDINQAARLPEFFSIPVGDRLRETLRSMNVAGNRICLDGLGPPAPAEPESSGSMEGFSVHDARKIMRSAQLEKVRSALRRFPVNTISYSQYIDTCVDVCSNRDQGVECAKKLDESGNVIVLGNVVFLQPDQVAKSMEKMITSIASPNNPRIEELDHMENQKAQIDRKAQQLVWAELYCGLGFFVLQNLGFMRLTFWELSWDVMEPICFFVNSIYVALAYVFFLRTSREPTFEGYFQRRFKVKQNKLMETHNFDVQKYNRLCRAFYDNRCDFTSSGPFSASAGCT